MTLHRSFNYLGLLIYVLLLSGCSSMGYYWQAMQGQLDIVSREQPIKEILQQRDLNQGLRSKLQLVQSARRFASEQLDLPDNGSYTEYSDLKRPYVTWNVIATPALSVTPRRWCYVFAGCFNYRGYFHKQDAREFANELKRQGYDVAITGAWAYSTLGWFEDPVLNTMLDQDNTDVIGTLFHELGHQTVYVKDDSSFNESFANAVEQAGLRRWFLHNNQSARYQAYLQRHQQRNTILKMLQLTRESLRELYAQPLSDEQKREQKRQLFTQLKQSYQQWRAQHAYSDYDGFMNQDLNNANLALIATYTDKVPAFLAMLHAAHGNFAAFYREARRVGELPPEQRQVALARYARSNE